MPNLTPKFIGDDKTVRTGEGRLSYLSVFEPIPVERMGGGKYSATILIPKTDTVTIDLINKAVANAKRDGADKLGKTGVIKTPLRDGDEEKPEDPAYEGCYFLKANSMHRPGILTGKGVPAMDAQEVYSGCYGYMVCSFYAYSKAGNKGIACSLGHIMKSRDGESFVGRGVSADEAFGDAMYPDNIVDPCADEDATLN